MVLVWVLCHNEVLCSVRTFVASRTEQQFYQGSFGGAGTWLPHDSVNAWYGDGRHIQRWLQQKANQAVASQPSWVIFESRFYHLWRILEAYGRGLEHELRPGRPGRPGRLQDAGRPKRRPGRDNGPGRVARARGRARVPRGPHLPQRLPPPPPPSPISKLGSTN